MHVEATVRYHWTHIRMANSNKTEQVSVGKNVEQFELSYAAGGKVKWYNHLDTVW